MLNGYCKLIFAYTSNISPSYFSIGLCSTFKILSSAKQKLGMSMPARRLFDADGHEIFRSKHIRRDEEYYASSGENFISYEARVAVSRRKASIHTRRSETVLVESTEYAFSF
jgi:hypothetical protein